jgi:glutamate racemase
MKNKIGIFDSGVGGLTVLKSLSDKYKCIDYIYIGDNKYCPYGDKTKEELLNYAKRIVNYFIEKGISIIVIACNTSCSQTLDELKQIYKNITFIGVIDSTIDIFLKSKKNNVLVIGTSATINSNIYESKIKEKNNNIKVTNLATPKLVPLIENMEMTKEVLNEYLNPYNDIDSIILACTHYKLIEKEIDKNIKVINSSDSIVNTIKNYIIESTTGSVKIYTTGNIIKFNKICKMIMNKEADYLDL